MTGRKYHDKRIIIKKCNFCGKEYRVKKGKEEYRKYCSVKCSSESRKTGKMKECEICGKEFWEAAWHEETCRRRFCSRECRGKSRRTGKMKRCEICGKQFYVIPSRKNCHFCSIECSNKSGRRGRIKKGRMKKCEICGKEFYIVPYQERNGKRFCSSECSGKNQRTGEMKKCETCGKKFYVILSRKNRRFCSRKCYCSRGYANKTNVSNKPGEMRRCEFCDKEFYVQPCRNQRFCSKKCSNKSRKTGREKKCKICGKKFYTKLSKKQQFCSRKCSNKGKRTPERAGKIKKCGICGKEFYVTSCNEKKQFCSNECRKTGRMKKCEICGKEFYVTPYTEKKGKGHFCSQECNYKSRRTGKIKKCETCNKEFYVPPCNENRRFCSRLCSYKRLPHAPTTPEIHITNIIESFNLPYEYTGSGKGAMSVGIRIPDWMSTDDTKKVILYHGGEGVYHFRDEEGKDMQYYVERGYDCLIFWKDDIENLPHGTVATKIAEFHGIDPTWEMLENENKIKEEYLTLPS